MNVILGVSRRFYSVPCLPNNKTFAAQNEKANE